MPDTLHDLPKAAFSPAAFLSRIGAGKTIEFYLKNQKIFSQGDVADEVFFIQKGKVKITVLSEQGKEAVVGIFEAGQFFGEACLEGAEVRTSTAQALEETLIMSITRPGMLAVLAADPKF